MSAPESVLALYAAGDLIPAREAALALIHQMPQEQTGYFVVACCAVRQANADEFVAALNRWAGVADDKGALCETVLRQLLDQRYYADLAALADAVPAQAPWSILCLYFAGCAWMMQGRRDLAIPLFMAFRDRVKYYAAHLDFIGLTALNVILRQGRLISGGADLARRLAGEAPTPPVRFLGEAFDAATGILFAACNGPYFNAMGQLFVESLLPCRGGMGIHVHVVSPDQRSLDIIDHLSRAHPTAVRFSVEEVPLFSSVTYYSCSRFFVMAEMLRYHGADVLCLDTDITLRGISAETLLGWCRGFDFCSFSTPRNDPASVYNASVMYFAHGREPVLAFLDRLRRFCWPELANPSFVNWLLDQAALFSLLSSPEQLGALRVGDLAAITGNEVFAYVAQIISESAKFALKDEVFRTEGREADLLPPGVFAAGEPA